MTKIAVVTRANRGIGFETCRQLAGPDYHIVLTSRDEARGQEATDILRQEGKPVSYHQLEVTDLTNVDRLRTDLLTVFGRVDVLINNAGIYPDEGASVFDVSLETVQLAMEINFYGPLYLCRTFVPMMHKQNCRIDLRAPTCLPPAGVCHRSGAGPAPLCLQHSRIEPGGGHCRCPEHRLNSGAGKSGHAAYRNPDL